MKNEIIVLLTAIFASACAPSEAAIQTAISQTQAAEISPTLTQPANPPKQLPTKAPTLSPTWTPEPACELSSDLKPEWQTTVCDTFENNDWGWYERNEEDDLAIIDVSVDDGQYLVDITGKAKSGYKGGVVQWFGFAKGQNFVASIDGKVTSKYHGVGWGLVFRSADHDGYFFLIGKEGWYRLDMQKNGEWFYPITYKTNSAIKWNETNNLTVLADGDNLEFYVNGTLIDSYESDQILGDQIALLVAADEGASATFIFDNALVKTE